MIFAAALAVLTVTAPVFAAADYGTMLPPQLGCMTDADCSYGETCNDRKICVANSSIPAKVGCMTDADCASGDYCDQTHYICVANSTIPPKVGCMTDADCSYGDTCNDRKICVAKEPTKFGCKVDADCDWGFYCGDHNICVARATVHPYPYHKPTITVIECALCEGGS